MIPKDKFPISGIVSAAGMLGLENFHNRRVVIVKYHEIPAGMKIGSYTGCWICFNADGKIALISKKFIHELVWRDESTEESMYCVLDDFQVVKEKFVFLYGYHPERVEREEGQKLFPGEWLYTSIVKIELPKNIIAIAIRTTMIKIGNMISLDTETTGLVAGDSLLLEIGMYGFVDGQELEYSRLIRYDEKRREKINAATKYNGITFDEIQKSGIDYSEAVSDLKENIDFMMGKSDIVLVGYNLEFDLEFLRKLDERIMDVKNICIMKEVMRAEAKSSGISPAAMRRISLKSALLKYGIVRTTEAHRALGDAMETFRLARRLQKDE